MSVKKYKFVSPGVFVSEIDNSQLTEAPGDPGPVLIGRAQRGRLRSSAKQKADVSGTSQMPQSLDSAGHTQGVSRTEHLTLCLSSPQLLAKPSGRIPLGLPGQGQAMEEESREEISSVEIGQMHFVERGQMSFR